MPIFGQHEVPIAYASITLARTCENPFIRYINYWIAFNNCYVTLYDADRQNRTELKRENGTIQFELNGSVKIPKVVKFPQEREQIEHAFDRFSEELKNDLIRSEHARFFLDRTPHLRRHGAVEIDSLGQKLNGVLSITRTIDAKNPVWSPIDRGAYERIQKGLASKNDIDLLSRQLLFLLYTVRNNLFHGSKAFDDANDENVVKEACPLLELILRFFVGDHLWS